MSAKFAVCAIQGLHSVMLLTSLPNLSSGGACLWLCGLLEPEITFQFSLMHADVSGGGL